MWPKYNAPAAAHHGPTVAVDVPGEARARPKFSGHLLSVDVWGELTGKLRSATGFALERQRQRWDRGARRLGHVPSATSDARGESESTGTSTA